MKLGLHWQILIGMVAGVLFGLAANALGWQSFTIDFIKPLGTIFINLLKLIAIPLIVVSLIKGISDLKDIAKLSSMGGRTIGLYLVSTVLAITIGLSLIHI